MPVRHDGDRRWVGLDVVLPGNPEQVWQAIATGPGYAAWFTRATIEERAGGAIAFDFGGGATSSGTVTTWQPPNHFGYEERDWSDDAPPVATEITITGRAGGTCVLRMTHSLFTSEDKWDGELEGFEAGWPGFFAVLRGYLRDFPGQPAGVLGADAAVAGSLPLGWQRITTALGLAGADLGQRREAPPDAPALAGTVERVQQDTGIYEVMLQMDRPAPGRAP
jgi:uncharacterized protein YndB with AHSA1/START domain